VSATSTLLGYVICAYVLTYSLVAVGSIGNDPWRVCCELGWVAVFCGNVDSCKRCGGKCFSSPKCRSATWCRWVCDRGNSQLSFWQNTLSL